MRRILFVGNWEAHCTVEETENYFRGLVQYSSQWQHEVIIAPPFTCLDAARKLLPPNVTLGAQDASHLGIGHNSGEIPCALLKPLGVKYAIVGHVKRRAMGEPNERINQKMKNCLANGITPIVCVGETLNEYEQNRTKEVIEKQISECLVGAGDYTKVVVAYQPLWALGTGFYAAGDFCAIIADLIRKTVQKLGGNPMAANFPILYGGSVTADNAREYLEAGDVDGLLVGPASTKAETFHKIVQTKFSIKKFNQEP